MMPPWTLDKMAPTGFLVAIAVCDRCIRRRGCPFFPPKSKMDLLSKISMLISRRPVGHENSSSPRKSTISRAIAMEPDVSKPARGVSKFKSWNFLVCSRAPVGDSRPCSNRGHPRISTRPNGGQHSGSLFET